MENQLEEKPVVVELGESWPMFVKASKNKIKIVPAGWSFVAKQYFEIKIPPKITIGSNLGLVPNSYVMILLYSTPLEN